MATNTRLRRPTLERTVPHRNWATSVSAGPPGQGAIESGVQDANRVIDDYLNAGQASARSLRNAVGVGLGNGNVQDVAQRMVRAASDLMSFWFDFMAQSAPASPASASSSKTSSSPTEPQHDGRPPVVVEVDAARPVAVTVDVRQGAKGSRLCLDRLHALGKGVPPLTGVRLETPKGDGPVVIAVRVDAKQPRGVYHGVVLDETTSRPVGTISVDVRPSRRSPRR